MKLSRRSVVRTLGVGALALLSGGWTRPGSRSRAMFSLEELAAKLLATPRRRTTDVVASLLQAGLSWRELEGAIYLAALRCVSPDPPGSLSHVILETESVFQLAESGPDSEALLPVLFHLDDLKSAQEREADRSGWLLPDAPEPASWNETRARDELRSALIAADPEAADLAATTLLSVGGQRQVIEVAWARAVGDLGGLGHKVIHAVHTERTLRRVGGATEPALRSLAMGLAVHSPAAAFQDFHESVESAGRLPESWERGDARPAESLALARSFVGSSPAAARAEALSAFEEGVSAASVWDAVRLGACDLYARRPSLLPVHPTTICNALAHMQRASRVASTRRVAMLQAVSWIPRLRDALVDRRRIPRRGTTLDELISGPEQVRSLEQTLLDPTPGQVRAYVEHAEHPAAFSSRLRSLLYRGVVQNHQVKYAAALLEDVGLAHPRWGAVLLAPSMGYLPSPQTPETAVHVRSLELLDARAR